MGGFIGIAVIAALVLLIRWMVKGMNPPSQADIAKAGAKKIEAKKQAKKSARPERLKNFALPPIPEGHQIYVKREYVAGVQHHANQIWELAGEDNPTLSWERDPENQHDENAIKIFSGYGSDKVLIGYVDRDLAASLADYDGFENLSIRFAGAKAHDNWLDVLYQITGPKPDKMRFERHTGASER